MVKFPSLVCEKAVGTNHNAVCCDMQWFIQALTDLCLPELKTQS